MKAEEKNIVSPELLAYFKWLIYTAHFKDLFAVPRGAMQRKFYIDWVDTMDSKEDSFRKKLMAQLEIWYVRFPPGKKRGRSSRAGNAPKANRWPCRSAQLEDPDEEDEGARPGLAIDGDGAGGEGSAGQ